MYIRELHVKNLKLMRDFRLSFCDPETGEPRKWTVLVGRNARGKTTVLQAIALAAAGPTLANSLARSVLSSFPDRRHETKRAVKIEAEFGFSHLEDVRKRPYPQRAMPGPPPGPPPKRLVSSMRLEPMQTVLRGGSRYGSLDDTRSNSGSNPLEDARASNTPWWFVAGYGVGRRMSISEGPKTDRPAEERLRSLFEPVSPTGLGFADHQSYGKEFASAFRKLLVKAIRAQSRTVPLISDIELRGAGGVSPRDLAEKDKFVFDIAGSPHKMPATYLSHGYQSTLSWIADLVGQFLLDHDGQGITDPRNLSGLVLIDELDLFLHPDWQIDFIDALSKTFPNLQFVATTHSPLLISKLRGNQVVQLEWDDDGNIEPRGFDGDPRLMTATELYRQLFDISSPPPTELARALSRHDYLAADPERTDEEDTALTLLRAELEEAGISELAEPASRVRNVS